MNPSDLGSAVFTVDFSLLKSYMNKIASEIHRERFIENIDVYSNDKNELSLKSIISLTNELIEVKSSIYSEDEENISVEYINKAIEYLENFTNNKFSEGDQQIKEIDEPKKIEVYVENDENKTLPNSNSEKVISNQTIKSKLSINKDEKKTNSSVDSYEILDEIQESNNEIKLIIENMISDAFINQGKSLDQKIQNIFSKMEVDKTDLLSNIQKSQKLVDEKITTSSTIFNKSANELMELFNSGKSDTNKLVELSVREEMKKGMNEGKIISELDPSDKKALKGVKIAVISCLLSSIGSVILFYMATQWYGDSVKYQNILKVEQNLPAYEQSVFTSIITTGYANTKENPRANPNNN